MYISENDNTKLLFSGKTTDDKMLCIKFVRRYSREVHERCASAGYALALYGFENLPGRWHMIIMEMITEGYCCLMEFPLIVKKLLRNWYLFIKLCSWRYPEHEHHGEKTWQLGNQIGRFRLVREDKGSPQILHDRCGHAI